ncbi:MAG: thioredoxin-like domain-containing protein [Acidobacteriota bacterium]
MLAALFAAVFAAAQTPAPPAADQEQAELSKAVGEAGGSAIDFTRALEKHLEKYPQSAQRPQIEKALVKAAMESNDRARIILYGARVLQAEPASDDLPLLDRVTRALLDTDDAESAKKALVFAKRYEAAVESRRSHPEGHMSEGQWAEEVNKGRARALVLEARATGNAGNAEEALKIARSAWEAQPNSEVARELAIWLAQLGRSAGAIEYYADAFTMEDGRSSEVDRARDRVRLSELYTKLNGSEKGLGDAILQAYDRMAALRKERLAQARRKDPNIGAAELVDFTLPDVDGTGTLSLASLKGKAVVMDFWATWCGPCRVQHPMIENVKKRFANAADVVFLSIDADEDRGVVPQFVKEMKWDHKVYYEAGLSVMLKISSIPTILVLDPSGKISSRMTGFIPERFEDMLAQRIEDARKN